MTSKSCAVIVALGAALLGATGASATTVFSAAGADIAAIQPTVDGFRAALGNPNNMNAAGPLAAGRREINWDGGGPPVVNGTPAATPFTTFQNSRGATFTTPGTGLTQAAATGGLLSLDLINATYAGLFAPFSANRLFTPLGSNVTDGFFSIPGTGGVTPAGVRGFGAVFSDVDLAGSTSIEFFDIFGVSLGVRDVLPATGNQTFSFLGIILDPGETLIGSIRIITGTTALGPNESSTVDLVVMDDFLYGEPHGVPLPATLPLVGLGLLCAAALSRAARARAAARGQTRARING